MDGACVVGEIDVLETIVLVEVTVLLLVVVVLLVLLAEVTVFLLVVVVLLAVVTVFLAMEDGFETVVKAVLVFLVAGEMLVFEVKAGEDGGDGTVLFLTDNAVFEVAPGADV